MEQGKALLPHLRAAGVPVTTTPNGLAAGRGRAWWEAREVRLAVAALRLVRSADDDGAAAEVLRAWGGLSAKAIAQLGRLAADHDSTILRTAARALEHSRLPPTVAPRVAYFLSRYSHWQSLGAGAFDAVLGAVATDHAGWAEDGPTPMQQLVHFALRCGSLDRLLEHSAFKDGSGGAAPGGLGGLGGGGGGEAVSLLTIHRSKGLEWDTVYLPGWEDGTFPLVPSRGATDEEWRLAYVALTRARDFAAISHASRRQWRGRWLQRAPSAFLHAFPSSSVKVLAPNQLSPYFRGQSKFRATQQLLFSQLGARRGGRGRYQGHGVGGGVGGGGPPWSAAATALPTARPTDASVPPAAPPAPLGHAVELTASPPPPPPPSLSERAKPVPASAASAAPSSSSSAAAAEEDDEEWAYVESAADVEASWDDAAAASFEPRSAEDGEEAAREEETAAAAAVEAAAVEAEEEGEEGELYFEWEWDGLAHSHSTVEYAFDWRNDAEAATEGEEAHGGGAESLGVGVGARKDGGESTPHFAFDWVMESVRSSSVEAELPALEFDWEWHTGAGGVDKGAKADGAASALASGSVELPSAASEAAQRSHAELSFNWAGAPRPLGEKEYVMELSFAWREETKEYEFVWARDGAISAAPTATAAANQGRAGCAQRHVR